MGLMGSLSLPCLDGLGDAADAATGGGQGAAPFTLLHNDVNSSRRQVARLVEDAIQQLQRVSS